MADSSSSRFLAVVAVIFAIIASSSLTYIITHKDKGNAGNYRAYGNGKHKPVNDVANQVAISDERIKELVAEYIIQNPLALVEAIQNARIEQQKIEQEKAKENISAKKDVLENDKGTPFVGNKDGDVVLVKFSDYNCGYCKRMGPDFQKILQEDKNVKIVMKDFPILGDMSGMLARAALAVYQLDSGSYFDFHISMLKKTPRNEAQILALAEEFGIDKAVMKKEMAKSEYENQLRSNLQLGQQIGVTGTPAFIINGKIFPGAVSYERLKTLVKQAREEG